MDRRETISSFMGLFGLGASNVKIEDIKDTERKCCEKHKDYPSAHLSFSFKKEIKKKYYETNPPANSLLVVNNGHLKWMKEEVEEVEEIKHSFCYPCIIEKLVEFGIPLPPSKES